MGRSAKGILIILAALFVLFSALLAPLVAAGLAVLFLLILGGYNLQR